MKIAKIQAQMPIELSKNFIISFCQRNKIRFIDLKSLNLQTTLEVDLNMDEYLIDKFLEELTNEFSLDYSEFNANKYLITGKYNFVILDFLRLFFGYENSWIKKFAKSHYYAPLTLEVLQKALNSGKLK